MPSPPMPAASISDADEATPSSSLGAWIASARAWIFLILLLIGFEVWARIVYHGTFLFNPFNAQSIAVFAVGPLLLALGQTFVVISGGIDLSVGFTMGFAAVVFSHVLNSLTPSIGQIGAAVVAVAVALIAAAIPGLINGWLIAHLKIPPFIGTLGMYGVARGIAYLLAGGTTVPIANPFVSFIGNGSFLTIPIIVLVTIMIVAVMHFVL